MMPSLKQLFTLVFLAFSFYLIWSLYVSFFQTPFCPPDSGHCLTSYIHKTPQPPLKLWVYSSLSQSPTRWNLDLLWHLDDFKPTEHVTKEISVTIPTETRNNGTLYVHVFITPFKRTLSNPFDAYWHKHQMGNLAIYSVPQDSGFQLVSESPAEKKPGVSDRVISHWRSRLTLVVMTDDIIFDRKAVPGGLAQYMWAYGDEYLPILYIHEINHGMKYLTPLNEESKEMPLKIVYTPVSCSKLRYWITMKLKVSEFLGYGLSEKDIIEAVFPDVDPFFLLLTIIITPFHLLFRILAFKSDVSYWQNQQSTVGLSTRAAVWRCVSTVIIFLYLVEQEASLLILIPSCIECFVDIWKMLKALKVTLTWSTWHPSYSVGTSSDQEHATQALDSQAMKYLSYVLCPLCVAGAIYSLFFTRHKSWYCWCIQSIVNGVYVFDFAFMFPQLFINYKLKSVAHLPWRVFVYKAVNTIFDDVFVFVLAMPTAHRLASFRDDVVFVGYLYQRWLYPVDPARVNEFGQSFAGAAGAKNGQLQPSSAPSSLSTGDCNSKKTN